MTAERKKHLFFNGIRIQLFILLVLLPTVVLGIGLGWVYLYTAKQLLANEHRYAEIEAQQQLEFLDRFFQEQKNIATTLSVSSDVIRPFIVLNKIYQRSSLNFDETAQVGDLRSSFTQQLTQLLEQFKVDQLFLIDSEGDINLSTGKEDLGNFNLYSEKLKHTELFNVFMDALVLMTEQVSPITDALSPKQKVFYVSKPVFSEGALVGILVLQLNAAPIANYLKEVNREDFNTTILVQQGTRTVSLMTLFSAEDSDSEQFLPNPSEPQRQGLFNRLLSTVRSSNTSFKAIEKYFPLMRWDLIIEKKTPATSSSIGELRQFIVRIAIFLVVGSVIVALVLAWRLTAPILILKEVIVQILRGNLDEHETALPKNELGFIGKALAGVRRKLKTFRNGLKQITPEIETTLKQVSKASNEQMECAQQINVASMSITSSARKISGTAKELAGTMQEVSEVAQDTALLAESGIDGLQIIENSMGDLTQANQAVSIQLRMIQDKANAISGIISTMTKVADQTNMISMNADIEAKKAGEYGRGFRTIAQVIRRLANQVAQSTFDIETMINEMLSAVHKGVEAMDHLSTKVRNGVREITNGSVHLSNVIQQVQGLPPRFETVLQGMQSQTKDSEDIRTSIKNMIRYAQQIESSLRETSQKLELLQQTSTHLNKEIKTFDLPVPVETESETVAS